MFYNTHTPGPWFAFEHADGTWFVADGDDPSDHNGCGPAVIASGISEADAKLISAAPQLLAAAQGALTELDGLGMTPHPKGAEGAGLFNVRRQRLKESIGKSEPA